MNTQGPTRIQKKNRAVILEAALDVFSTHGFRGSTVDQIAKEAGLSKPNLLYYFPSKEAIHASLLEQMARGKTSAEFHSELRRQGITHVLVNWSEIRRYRDPHSYGYTDYVQPALFTQWQADGVLRQVFPATSSGTTPRQEVYAVK